LQGREAHSSTALEIVVQVAAEATAQGLEQAEKPAIGAALQEDAVEPIVQLYAGGDVAPSLLQAPDDLAKAAELIVGRLRGLVEGEGLEGCEDGADLPELGSGHRGQPKASAGLSGEHPLAGQPDEGLPDRSAADPELGGDGSVAELGACGEASALNALQELKIDLIAEGIANY
jgi:hypothetical protein